MWWKKYNYEKIDITQIQFTDILHRLACITCITCITLYYLYSLYYLHHLNFLHHLYRNWMHFSYYVYYVYHLYLLYHLYYLIYWKSEKVWVTHWLTAWNQKMISHLERQKQRKTQWKILINKLTNQEHYMMNAYMHSGGTLIAPAVGKWRTTKI